ncbi:MAG: hypothetical protein CTY19_06570 [Methylomonas sp.]|nr:MAG: hypothetical protein CTY19_06570 [Methylomonas sp.]
MLVEPVALSDFFLSFFSAAMIIFTATLYAGLFAWARISGQKSARIGACVSYASLLASVAVFSDVNHLTGYWLLLSFSMVIGYALMPHAIWHLCVATHLDETDQ